MKLNRNSWHYKLNDFIIKDGLRESKYPDFCSYFWRTVGSVLLTICFVALAALVVTLVVICWELVLFLIGTVILLFSIFAFAKFVSDKVEGKIQSTEPGFLRASYRKFRDKTCHKLEWE